MHEIALRKIFSVILVPLAVLGGRLQLKADAYRQRPHVGTRGADVLAEECLRRSQVSMPGKMEQLPKPLGVLATALHAAWPMGTRWRRRRRDTRWSLDGQAAVVTGGSKGLGRAIVEELLEQGCIVLTCARDLTPLKELLASNSHCMAIEADVSTAEGRAALHDEIERRFGKQGLNILVNNVGTNLRKASTDYTDEEYDMLHATNQASAFHLTRGCYESLRKARGCVIMVSSVSGSSNDATGAVYHMTKAAMEHMTRYLACEWGPDGIRVNAVAPWFIRTPLTEPLLARDDFHAAVRKATPLKRVGEPYEVACTVAFLAMDAAGYITGQVVGIDGGMMQEGFRYSEE